MLFIPMKLPIIMRYLIICIWQMMVTFFALCLITVTELPCGTYFPVLTISFHGICSMRANQENNIRRLQRIIISSFCKQQSDLL